MSDMPAGKYNSNSKKAIRRRIIAVTESYVDGALSLEDYHNEKREVEKIKHKRSVLRRLADLLGLDSDN